MVTVFPSTVGGKMVGAAISSSFDETSAGRDVTFTSGSSAKGLTVLNNLF